jgi:hypothetical protein
MVAKVNLSNRNPDNDPVANDLNKAVIHLETGYDSVMAANWLAEHCPLPEVQAALRLMARYEREGGREILELIRMQADQRTTALSRCDARSRRATLAHVRLSHGDRPDRGHGNRYPPRRHADGILGLRIGNMSICHF